MADDNTLDLQAGRDVNIGGHVVGGDMIVRQEAPTTPTPAAPPRPPAHFAGRERELSKLIQTLVAGEAVAITALQGMGGIGKTALAQKAAEMLQPHFPGGVLWWTAGPRADIFTALDVWARHADPRSDLSRLPEAEARAVVVRAMLAKLGRLCSILDDVWDEAAARVLLAAIPPGCPILLTTRDADLAKALRCRVERLGALTVDESVALLEKLLGPLRPPQPPLSGGAGGVGEAAREIATLTEGLPLALELIAGLADSPADLPGLAARLKQQKPLDALRLGSGADREHSVEACFALSYNALDPEAQRRFRALGVFAPAPFDEDAVLAVWGDPPNPLDSPDPLDPPNPPNPPFQGGQGDPNISKPSPAAPCSQKPKTAPISNMPCCAPTPWPCWSARTKPTHAPPATPITTAASRRGSIGARWKTPSTRLRTAGRGCGPPGPKPSRLTCSPLRTFCGREVAWANVSNG